MSDKMKEVPGTYFPSSDFKTDKVLSFHWRPNAKYAWSAGVAYSRFLEELKKGRIIGRKCGKCERVIVPPRMFCDQCFCATEDWIYVKDTGKINTYSISYLDADANRITEPIPVAVIDLDGASPNVGILHYLGNVKLEELKIGMPLKAVWKPAEEREGSMTDILYFEPIKEG